MAPRNQKRTSEHTTPLMTNASIRLRPWQRAAVGKFAASEALDFLAVATPGAGKTTFALTCARMVVAERGCRVVIVAPTAHLKLQWAVAAARFGLHLDHEWGPGDGRLPADMHGVVTSYQQVATANTAKVLRNVAAGAFVIFDEVHHAGDERAWGTSIRTAFDGALRRLSISGTPFRSDTLAIPFMRYVNDEAVSDYDYGYADALRDGAVVRPVYFPHVDGLMEWTAPDGSLVAASFQDGLVSQQASQRLRTALSLEGDWLPSALRAAHDRLMQVREHQPSAAGLVIAIDQDHAKGIARLLRDRIGTTAEVVTSDDPTSSARISAFTNASTPWIVAVRMVSEGVDIPRLRVGVFATTTATELFFRQAVGRLVRWQSPSALTGTPTSQKAFFFIPDDPRLRHHAFQIADQRRHCLRPPPTDDDVDGLALTPEDAAPLDKHGEPEQLSLFSVISAVATDITVHASTRFVPGIDDEPDPVDPHLEDDPSLLVDLAPLPILSAAGDAIAYSSNGTTLQQRKHELRDRNASLARLLVDRTGLSHAKVNAEMNRLGSIASVTEATLEQLQRRLDKARAWYDKTGMR